jgi:hypothetical protein
MAHAMAALAPWLACLGILLWMGLQANPASGGSLWQEDEQRFRVGLKIFPAVLGALEGLEAKRSPDGALTVVVAYEGSAETADQAASDLRDMGQIHDLPLNVTTMTATALDKYAGAPIGGIFVASVGIGTQRLRAWSAQHRALVFSPFAGDVEAGAVAGIHIADQIRPYVNAAQAERAGLRFKAFFLQAARQHE